ncbi:MAG: glucosaminidase domain-containing protein [Rhodospirillales bacterium]
MRLIFAMTSKHMRTYTGPGLFKQLLALCLLIAVSATYVAAEADTAALSEKMSPNSAKGRHSSINIDAWSKLENQNFTAELPLNYITLTRTNLPVFTLLSELTVSLNFAAETSYIKQLSKQPTVPALEAFWRDRDHSLEAIKRGADAPRLFLSRLPSDLPEIRDVQRRKQAFISSMLPHVLAANEEILRDRSRILKLRLDLSKVTKISESDLKWLAKIFDDYELTSMDFDQLLKRVDVIPPALAIAQAAKESGWGVSRFAQKGNAIYGQWTWNPKDKGMVPLERPEGKKYRVRAFNNVLDASRSYAKNLNTSHAYEGFRNIRFSLRKSGKPISGYKLAETLTNYSTSREIYVSDVQEIIIRNQLKFLNSAQLTDTKQYIPRQGLQKTELNLESLLSIKG